MATNTYRQVPQSEVDTHIDDEQGEGINLDCTSTDPDVIWGIGCYIRRSPVKAARRLFKGRPEGYVSAAKALGAYAENKATAMRCRISGNITAAICYERICEDIYEGLPAFARW